MNQNNNNNFSNNPANDFQNGMQGGYTPYQPPQAPQGKGLSIAGFVISLVSIISCCWEIEWLVFPLLIVGLVLSAIGMTQSRKSGKTNGLAIAGLVISIIHAVFWVVIFAMFIAFGKEIMELAGEFLEQYGTELDFSGQYGTDL